MTAQWIIDEFEKWSPMAYAEEWDNVGLLVGSASWTVKKILVALDVTDAVIHEAITGDFDFIICHHPLIYNPVKRVTDDDSTGRKIVALIKNGIGCYCAHTNLDKAIGGVNDCLAKKIGLQNAVPLIPEECPGADGFPAEAGAGIGRVGFLPAKTTLAEFFAELKISLGISAMRFCGDGAKKIEKVGICGGDGSGQRYIDAAVSHGCDAYVTGDLRYHAAQDAVESGLALVDITHYGGEIFVLDEIIARIKNASQNRIEIFASSINGQIFDTE